MTSYQYVAVDPTGKQKKGMIEANSPDHAISLLKSEGKVPLKVSEQNFLNKDLDIQIGNPVKPRDLAVFCRQFHSIVASGVTIIRALDMLSVQTSNKVLRKSIKETKIAIEKGETMANAMRSQGTIFPSILINMVETAEASGNIDACFGRMATQFEKSAKLKATIKKSMVYPIIVGIVAVAVIILMLTVIIPNFMDMFNDMGAEMPALTMMVVKASEFMTARWYFVVAIGFLLYFVIHMLKGTEQGKLFFGTLGLKMPMVGSLIIKGASANLGRTLSTLISSGLNLPEAVEITAKNMSNVIIQNVLLDAKKEIERGTPLSIPLEASKLFPPMVHNMVNIGEETGNLEHMLEKIADYYEEDVEVATQSLLTVLEPMMILTLALIVGVILLAVFQPMLSIYSAVDGM